MSIHDIRSTDTAVEKRDLPPGFDPAYHERHYQPGLTVTMVDGARWFHPYDGSTPWRLPAARALELGA
jgi:hypothetical protein